MANILDLLNNPFILGAGLTGLSTLGRDEPGYVTEARQAIRNIEQPAGYSSVFGQTVSGLQDQFLPLLKQQAETGIADVSQRYAHAFPGSVGMQGGEIAGLNRYLRDQLVPTQQAFLGNLGISGIGQQQSAANTILKENTDDPLRQGIATLAAAMLMKSIYGGGTGTGTGIGSGTGVGGTLQSIWDLIRGTPPTAPPGGGSALNTILGNIGPIASAIPSVAGGVSGLTAPMWASLFGAGGAGAGAATAIAPMAAGETATAIQLLTSMGVPPAEAASIVAAQGGAGVAGTGSAGAVAPGAASTAGAGLSLSSILSSLGAAAAGGGAGYMIGGQLPSTQLGATAAGGAGGALAGVGLTAGLVALGATGIGLPLAAIIGAIAGGAGGFFGSRGASSAIKAANLKADSDSQTGQSRAVADFFLPAIEQIGGNTEPLMEQVANLINTTSDPGDQQGQIAKLLGDQLLSTARQADPSIVSLSDIPGFRESFMSYMMKNAYVSPTSSSSRPLNELEAGHVVNAASGTTADIFTGAPRVTPDMINYAKSLGAQLDPEWLSRMLNPAHPQGGGDMQYLQQQVKLARGG